jgi:hypothetical protein
VRLGLRTPFFGMPEDREILGEPAAAVWPEVDTPPLLLELTPGDVKVLGADEIGAEIALGFMPCDHENRRTRRKASATWAPPKINQDRGPEATSPPAPAMPTRRELFEQRQKHQRGKLDPELRAMQRERLKQK